MARPGKHLGVRVIVEQPAEVRQHVTVGRTTARGKSMRAAECLPSVRKSSAQLAITNNVAREFASLAPPMPYVIGIVSSGARAL